MQGRYARMVATLRRVILFFDNLPEGTDVGNVGPQLARLRELVVGFEGHAIAQAAGRRLALASTAHTRILKQRLRIDHMRRIARMSHAALDLPTGTPAALTAPYERVSTEALVAAAGSMATAAAPHAAVLTANGLPEDFLSQLAAAAAAVQASVAEHARNAEMRVAGSKGVSEAVRKGMVIVRALDGMVEPAIRDNGKLLAAWRFAKAVEGHSARSQIIYMPPVVPPPGTVRAAVPATTTADHTATETSRAEQSAAAAAPIEVASGVPEVRTADGVVKEAGPGVLEAA